MGLRVSAGLGPFRVSAGVGGGVVGAAIGLFVVAAQAAVYVAWGLSLLAVAIGRELLAAGRAGSATYIRTERSRPHQRWGRRHPLLAVAVPGVAAIAVVINPAFIPLVVAGLTIGVVVHLVAARQSRRAMAAGPHATQTRRTATVAKRPPAKKGVAKGSAAAKRPSGRSATGGRTARKATTPSKSAASRTAARK